MCATFVLAVRQGHFAPGIHGEYPGGTVVLDIQVLAEIHRRHQAYILFSRQVALGIHLVPHGLEGLREGLLFGCRRHAERSETRERALCARIVDGSAGGGGALKMDMVLGSVVLSLLLLVLAARFGVAVSVLLSANKVSAVAVACCISSAKSTTDRPLESSLI